MTTGAEYSAGAAATTPFESVIVIIASTNISPYTTLAIPRFPAASCSIRWLWGRLLFFSPNETEFSVNANRGGVYLWGCCVCGCGIWPDLWGSSAPSMCHQPAPAAGESPSKTPASFCCVLLLLAHSRSVLICGLLLMLLLMLLRQLPCIVFGVANISSICLSLSLSLCNKTLQVIRFNMSTCIGFIFFTLRSRPFSYFLLL